MTTNNTRPDLWGEDREWEQSYSPSQMRDMWRETMGFLDGLYTLQEGTSNETMTVVMGDAVWRARQELEHFEEEVAVRLKWNMDHGRRLPFGEVLIPFLERAGLSPRELLAGAGRLEEPHAEQTLLRHIYGPARPCRGRLPRGLGRAARPVHRRGHSPERGAPAGSDEAGPALLGKPRPHAGN
ncbi:MAG: hypothetical protein H0U55_14725 [Rubrobacteraceae bacterium]|nr:hypothetical protein [Rubrobacteraceae bacterium]